MSKTQFIKRNELELSILRTKKLLFFRWCRHGKHRCTTGPICPTCPSGRIHLNGPTCPTRLSRSESGSVRSSTSIRFRPSYSTSIRFPHSSSKPIRISDSSKLEAWPTTTEGLTPGRSMSSFIFKTTTIVAFKA